jgi:hypothetical protein
MKLLVNRMVSAYWCHVDRVIDTGRVDRLEVLVARVETVVRAYFAFVFFSAFSWSRRAVDLWVANEPLKPKLGLGLSHQIPLEFWPETCVVTAFAIVFGSAIACWMPHLRWPRILTIGSCLLFWAIYYDFTGKIDHGLHPTLWAGIALCFLPSRKPSQESDYREYLGAFWGTQVIVALLYTCAGLCKLLGVAFDWGGGVTWFNPDALPLTLAKNWDRSESMLLSRFLITNPYLSMLLNIGVVYLEVATVFAVLRPRLHQLWAIALLVMHFSVLHSMMINFYQSCIILMLFLLGSPFRPKWKLAETLCALPLAHGALTLFNHFRRTDGHHRRTSEPHIPRSWALRFWLPILVPTYLLLSFSRLDYKKGAFREDIFPTSAMWMFWRIDSSSANLKKLKDVRSEIERSGTLSPRKPSTSAKSKS